MIVYYSLEGNTEYAANKTADILGADTLRLFSKKAYPDKGFKKFLWGGKSAVMAEKPELEPYSFDPEGYERIILGFPVWASNVAPPIRTFIAENDIKNKNIAAFACEGGSGAEKAFAKLAAAIGIPEIKDTAVLIDPKARPDEENERKIREFCEKLRKS